MNQETEKSPEEILAEIKANMVPKEKFNQLENKLEETESKYRKLFKEVANGVQTFDGGEPKTEKEKYEDFKEGIVMLNDHKMVKPVQHFKTLLAIDDYQRENGKRSIFEPSIGDRTEDVINSANKARDTIQYALDNCNGSDELFTAQIQNSLRDMVR